MPGASLELLLKNLRNEDLTPTEDVIVVSETVSMAASVYETIRNTLEYDEEHLLRRNAIRRFLKRRLGEDAPRELAENLLRELIWARYLHNKAVPVSRIGDVERVIAKYNILFAQADADPKRRKDLTDWLLDVLSTEIEHTINPPRADEALASFAYGLMQGRVQWNSNLIPQADRDMQLYIALHRAVLKSNLATLRYRVFTLYYPAWADADAGADVVAEVSGALRQVVDCVECQLNHRGAEALLRRVRRFAVVFHVLRDAISADANAFATAVSGGDKEKIKELVTKAAGARYKRFRSRLRRGVLRAVLFLFFTKMLVALLFEWPYERLILEVENSTPLLVNILFHPVLLGVIGLSVVIPERKNTSKILEEIGAIIAGQPLSSITFQTRRAWHRGAVGAVFNLLYAVFFLFTIGLIAFVLRQMDFNALSIVFFLFFLSLVLFFGLKIRNTRRELVLVEVAGGWLSGFIDILFLPIIRAGRWIALRAPRINIFLFFFDFIVEAPFKASIRLVESWLAFLKEKREEI